MKTVEDEWYAVTHTCTVRSYHILVGIVGRKEPAEQAPRHKQHPVEDGDPHGNQGSISTLSVDRDGTHDSDNEIDSQNYPQV